MNIIRYQTPELSTWPTFDRFSMLRNELERLFDFSLPTRDSGLVGAWTPALDVHEDKDNYFVSVELPGMKKDEIDISLHGGFSPSPASASRRASARKATPSEANATSASSSGASRFPRLSMRRRSRPPTRTAS